MNFKISLNNIYEFTLTECFKKKRNIKTVQTPNFNTTEVSYLIREVLKL